VDERDAAVGDRRVSRAGIRREQQGIRGGGDAGRDLLRPDFRSVQEAGCRGTEGRSAAGGHAFEYRPGVVHGAGACEERGGCGVRPRSAAVDVRGSAVRSGAGRTAGRGEVEHAVLVRTDDRQHGTRGRRGCALRALQALVPDAEQLLPDAGVAHARRSSGHRREVLH
jgi:hypothetical protein